MLSSDKPLRKIKILLLGDSGVGKTSLIHRYTKDDFNPSLVGTVGVDFKVKKVHIDGETVNLQVWDTAGQEHFHRITQAYYRGSHAIMLVFDISEKRTLDSVSYWMGNILAQTSGSIPVILVGNKKDLRAGDRADKCVQAEDGANAAYRATEEALSKGASLNIEYYETSAKTSEQVETAFLSILRTILRKDSAAAVAAAAPVSETVAGTVFRAPKDRPESTGSSLSNATKSLFGWMGKKK